MYGNVLMGILHPIQVVLEDKVTHKRYNNFSVVLKDNFMFIFQYVNQHCS